MTGIITWLSIGPRGGSGSIRPDAGYGGPESISFYLDDSIENLAVGVRVSFTVIAGPSGLRAWGIKPIRLFAER